MISASDAAELLGVDKRTVLRLARSGELPSYRTPGGQHRFRREDVEKLASVNGRAGGAPSSVSRIQNKREELEALNLEVQARRARRDLASLDAEDEAAEQRRTEERRAESLARRRVLEESRAKREQEQKERYDARTRETAERERQAWMNQTISRALATLPRDVPLDIRASAGEALSKALARFAPGDSPEMVALATDSAIATALAPWRRSKQIEAVIEEQERSLPTLARSLICPTPWQVRFHAASTAAIHALPADASMNQIRAAAQGEARKLADEFERSQAEERHRRNCGAWLKSPAWVWGVMDADHKAASDAVAKALAQLPVGCSETDMCQARDRALVPFKRRKEMTERAEQYLVRVDECVRKLKAPDGADPLTDHLQRNRLVEWLKNEIRPDLIDALLSGEIETPEDSRIFIEDAVEAALENER